MNKEASGHLLLPEAERIRKVLVEISTRLYHHPHADVHPCRSIIVCACADTGNWTRIES